MVTTISAITTNGLTEISNNDTNIILIFILVFQIIQLFVSLRGVQNGN